MSAPADGARARAARRPATARPSSTTWLKTTPHGVGPGRQASGRRRERARDRLRLEVKVEAGEVAPAGVAAQLDEARAPHDARREPAQEPDRHGRAAAGAGTAARRASGHEEGAEEAGLDELELPAEAVERLPDAGDRDLQDAAATARIERVGVAEQHRRRQRDAEEAGGAERARRRRRARRSTAARGSRRRASRAGRRPPSRKSVNGSRPCGPSSAGPCSTSVRNAIR